MISRWVRRLIWEPYERACRILPLWPFRSVVSEPADGVKYIRIDNGSDFSRSNPVRSFVNIPVPAGL